MSPEERDALSVTDSALVEAIARKLAELDGRDADSHPESEYTGPVVPDIAWPTDHKIWMIYAWKARHIVLMISRHGK